MFFHCSKVYAQRFVALGRQNCKVGKVPKKPCLTFSVEPIDIFFFCMRISMLVTACADGTCGAFDAQTGERISTFKGHTASVTCCTSTQIGPELTVSGSSDGSVKVHYADICIWILCATKIQNTSTIADQAWLFDPNAG